MITRGNRLSTLPESRQEICVMFLCLCLWIVLYFRSEVPLKLLNDTNTKTVGIFEFSNAVSQIIWPTYMPEFELLCMFCEHKMYTMITWGRRIRMMPETRYKLHGSITHFFSHPSNFSYTFENHIRHVPWSRETMEYLHCLRRNRRSARWPNVFSLPFISGYIDK